MARRPLSFGERLENLRLGRSSHAGERSDPLPFGRRLQLGQRRHAELPPDPRCGLRAEAGKTHERRDLAGHLRAPLGERRHVAGLRRPRRSWPRSSCRCPEAPSPCPGARAPRRTTPYRGSASQRDGRRRRGTTARRGSPRGPRAGRTDRPDRCCEGAPRPCPDHRARPDVQDWGMRAMVCLPTYNERENLEPMVRALGEQLDTDRRSRARDRRQLARRHRRARRRARCGAAVGRSPPPAGEGRPRAGVHRGLQARPRRRSGARASRSTATSPTTPRTCRG